MTAALHNVDVALLDSFIKRHPNEAIVELEKNSAAELVVLFTQLPPSALMEMLPRLERSLAQQVLLDLPIEQFKLAIDNLALTTTISFLLRLNKQQLEHRLNGLPDKQKRELLHHLSFEPKTAGAMMERDFFSCQGEDQVAHVIEELRKFKLKRVLDIFVTDRVGKLLGSLDLRDLVMADPKGTIDTLNLSKPSTVSVFAQEDEIAEKFEEAESTTMAVIGIDEHILGVINYGQLMETFERDVADALVTMTGASPEEHAFSGPIEAMKRRLPWLSINLLTAFLAAAIVGAFEGTIAKVTSLAVVMSVVAGQSGNTGAQSMAVTMRGLAIREVRVKHLLKLLFKEARVGLLNGIAVALLSFIGVYVWSKDVMLSAILFISMVFSMVLASLSGALVPMVLTSLGRDPAQSSSIILSTITDCISFLSFLGLATLLIQFLVR